MPVSDDHVYDAIRNEAVQRVNICYGKYNIVITAFGVLAVAAIQFHQPVALLLYPALALSLALSWHHNSLIARKISEKLSELSTYEQELRDSSPWDKVFDYSNRVIFGVTSLVSILLGIVLFPEILQWAWGLWVSIILALGAFVPAIFRE